MDKFFYSHNMIIITIYNNNSLGSKKQDSIYNIYTTLFSLNIPVYMTSHTETTIFISINSSLISGTEYLQNFLAFNHLLCCKVSAHKQMIHACIFVCVFSLKSHIHEDMSCTYPIIPSFTVCFT